MRSLRPVAVLSILIVVGTARAAVIDLGPWSVVQYEQFDQPDANWVLSDGNTVATQTINADASILLSDFDAVNTEINGKWRVNSSDDDDFMGFVFGYQGRGHFYLFDWKQADQNDGLFGFAERGMSIKVVDVPGGADPPRFSFWKTTGAENVTNLYHNLVTYNDFTTYDFRLRYNPGRFSIEVREGANLLLSQTIEDSTYTSGAFGFYNYSQGAVRYEGFTSDPAPDTPEPSTLVGAALVGLSFSMRRLRRLDR